MVEGGHYGAPIVVAQYWDSSAHRFAEHGQTGRRLPGELLHLGAQLTKLAVDQLADPATYHQVPTFHNAAGGDWKGFDPTPQHTPTTDQGPGSAPVEGSVPPDRYYDSLPGLGLLLGQLENLTEAANTQYANYVQASMSDQPRYLGTTYDATPFRNANHYLSQTRRWSGAKTKKHLARAHVLAHTPGGNPDALASHPTYPTVGGAYADGRLSAEIVDRIVDMRTQLHKYAGNSDVPPGLVDQVMAAFEPVLAEAGEHVTPEELSAAKKGWMDQIAHELNADGPSPSQALRKPPDNAIKTKSFPEGGGRIWLDATPDVYNQFKNFVLHMLKADGTPPDIPFDVRNLIHPAGTTGANTATTGQENGENTSHPTNGAGPAGDEQSAGTASAPDEGAGHNASASEQDVPHSDDAPFGEVPDNIDDLPLHDAEHNQVGAEDAQGNTYTTNDLNAIDPMSSGQQIAALLIGMFRIVLRMHPTELGVKQSHGASAQLVITQDLQTAYHTLGVPPLPPDLRRPAGPAGLTPPTIRHPNPDASEQTAHHHGPPDPGDACPCRRHDPGEPAIEGRHTRFINQFPWTPYRSEALNHGSMHPADAEILSCDSELVAQLWDGPDTVLQQKRTKRLFTTAQRRAILARDRGCQAPGCTTPAVFCDIHHIKDWLAGGNTSVNNAITLCSHHHTAVHIGKWRIRKHHGHTWFQPAIWLDPYQPLLRNLHWNT